MNGNEIREGLEVLRRSFGWKIVSERLSEELIEVENELMGEETDHRRRDVLAGRRAGIMLALGAPEQIAAMTHEADRRGDDL